MNDEWLIVFAASLILSLFLGIVYISIKTVVQNKRDAKVLSNIDRSDDSQETVKAWSDNYQWFVIDPKNNQNRHRG